MNKDEKCFYCSGRGKFKYIKSGDECVCSVCGGTGINFKALHENLHAGKNKCKYCGAACSGYACKICLDSFENDNRGEEL